MTPDTAELLLEYIDTRIGFSNRKKNMRIEEQDKELDRINSMRSDLRDQLAADEEAS